MRKNNIINKLSKEEIHVINLMKNKLNELGVRGYIVGGAVRDILLDKEIKDIDICITCNPMCIINQLKEVKSFKYYKKFETSTIIFNNGIEIDLIRCRKESYSYPGVLPEVIPSSIEDDLYRRDFTINSIAYNIIGNEIIDRHNGTNDLELKKIAKVHDNSYTEDPTRIFRAVKYSVRYNFGLEDIDEIKDNLQNGVLKFISNDRIMREIILLCEEEKWIRNILLCKKLGIFNINKELLGKQNDLCNYSDINHRIINLFLSLRDREDRNIFTDNSVLNRKLKEALVKYNIEIEKVSHFTCKTIDNFIIYDVLKNLNEYELILYSFDYKNKYKIYNYLNNLKNIKLKIRGNEIKELGINEGKKIGNILKYLLKIKMNTMIANEENLLKRNLGEILNGVEHKN
ncbi:CCA tRNA nucleotidyltransferase [Clostridium ganghwense]|uniref:CCA tRNA nucleotidyltransferase n=1 Tax=Clostridium ganghwense TaxID=312089 RepID=A0ABT4CML9_9CLOT|nr:CCA tRNA nucleotidyltransferase [Clostridium ganghwense]MCY6370297.1 CCA tRNA nucleotidyltransferase [Clostridium ganghwense]